MRDLKHLIYFENLLENSNNELIQQAQEAGRKAIGHVCYQIPEPLLNLPGIFSVRLRAPRTTSTEMGNYYLSPIFCEACRAILERALEGGFSFLDALIAPEACAMMNRLAENIEHLGCCPHEGFFASYCDVPMKSDEVTLKHYVLQMQEHCLKPLHEHLGIDVSDAAIRKAVEEQNKISRLITEIGEYRKEESPRITGYEFAIFCLATYCCPKDLLIEKLEETAEELKTRVSPWKSTVRAWQWWEAKSTTRVSSNSPKTPVLSWLRTDTASALCPADKKSYSPTTRTHSRKFADTICNRVNARASSTPKR